MEVGAAVSVGGLSPEKQATPGIQAIAEQVKGQLESKVSQNFAVFCAVSYREQVVAGTNYFIKVRNGEGEKGFCHLRVFEPLPAYGGQQCQLSGYQLQKTREEPITYF